MSAWHDPEHTVIDAFLEISQFRPASRPTYRGFLRSFEEAALRHPAVDRPMLEAWLKEQPRPAADGVLHGLAELAAESGRDDHDAALVLAWQGAVPDGFEG